MDNNLTHPNRDILCEMGCEDAIVFDNPDYDSAIVGITNTDQVVYDYHKMIEYLMNTTEMDEIEAIEFIDYNSSYHQGYPYPLIMYGVNTYE